MIYENLSEHQRTLQKARRKNAWQRMHPPQEITEPIAHPLIKAVADLVCENGPISSDKIKTRNRGREYVDSRQMIHYIVRKLYKAQITQETLTIETGLRNHTTVINSIIAVQNRIDTDKEFKLRIENLIERLS